MTVELATIRTEFADPRPDDRADWEQVRCELRRIVGESTFEIWFASVELVGTDSAGCLLLHCPSETRSWVVERFAQILERASQSVGRRLRVASDRELQLLAALSASPPLFPNPIGHDHKEAV